MEEIGALKQIRQKYEPKPQICPDYTGVALGFNSCFSAFSVWIGGAVVALILFSIEMFSKLIGTKFPFMECYDNVNVLETKLPSSYDEIRDYFSAMESEIKTLTKELGEKKMNQKDMFFSPSPTTA